MFFLSYKNCCYCLQWHTYYKLNDSWFIKQETANRSAIGYQREKRRNESIIFKSTDKGNNKIKHLMRIDVRVTFEQPQWFKLTLHVLKTVQNGKNAWKPGFLNALYYSWTNHTRISLVQNNKTTHKAFRNETSRNTNYYDYQFVSFRITNDRRTITRSQKERLYQDENDECATPLTTAVHYFFFFLLFVQSDMFLFFCVKMYVNWQQLQASGIKENYIRYSKDLKKEKENSLLSICRTRTEY